MHAQRGQAAVELVAVLPLLAALLAGLWQAALIGQAAWASASAARAAARAAAVGGSPRSAARAHLPDRLERGMAVAATVAAGFESRSACHRRSGSTSAAPHRRPGSPRSDEARLRPVHRRGHRPAATPARSRARSVRAAQRRVGTRGGERGGRGGAVALLQGRDARAAARDALGRWPRDRTRIVVAGRRVTVRVTPSGPFGARLRATVTADAGARARRAGRPLAGPAGRAGRGELSGGGP